MDKKRKVYAPFSLTSEAGVAQTPVEGYIDVNQAVYPTVNTGEINENGKWIGVRSSDSEFIGLTKAEAVANGGEVLFPSTNNFPAIDMTGYKDIFIALKPTRSGEVAIQAVMGPDTERFANLSPVKSGFNLRGADALDSSLENMLLDSGDSLTADLWTILIIKDRLAEQKLLQFKVTNNSGGNSDIEFGFMRLI